MSDFPDFDSFYKAVNAGRSPLPWQARLAREVATSGRWPSEIGVPTGLGKTSCLDIAIYGLAAQADRPPRERTAPTRIWYVVDRRLLVDAATERARHLAALLSRPEEAVARSGTGAGEVVRAVADALRRLSALGSDAGPLHVTQLRGGAELGARAPDPSQPALVLATVPMFASRLLFRGFGSSRAMWPVDAAHAGIDTLVLLDEAHLSRPLMRLVDLISSCDLGDPGAVIAPARARPVLVALTATGEQRDDRFELDGDDFAHPLVARRLSASKPTALVEVERAKLSAALADAAVALCAGHPGGSCVVFCNTARRAREVERLLTRSFAKVEDAPEIVLLTGRSREREASLIRSELLDERRGLRAGRRLDSGPGRSRIVVATQTLEVGADLDFDFLVSESASVRALTQRLGRLNRLGERPHAAAILCHPRDGEDPVYGTEPAAVCERLRARGTRDLPLGSANITELLGEPADVPPRAAELLPEHLVEYAKTARPEPGEPPPELFYAGLDERSSVVSLCWRAYLPLDGVRLVPAADEAESIDVPIGEVREVFGRAGLDSLRRLTRDLATLETVSVSSLSPGDVVVLPADSGLYDDKGWNPEDHEVVLDAGLLASGALPLSLNAIRLLVAPTAGDLGEVEARLRTLEADEPDPDVEVETLTRLLQVLRAVPPHPWMREGEWDSYLGALELRVVRPVADIGYLLARRDARRAPESRVRAEAFEELSFDATSVALDAHLGSVGEAAQHVATRLGLNSALVDAVRLAARCHDLGKADPRFQRWLDPDAAAPGLVAKSSAARECIEAGRLASGWPRGGRHEVISARLVQSLLANLDLREIDADLVVHLVASHHGHARPLIEPVADVAPVRVGLHADGRWLEASGDLSVVDWEQPRRFRGLCERYGLWGLCLLEAVVRQADHAVSSAVKVA